MANENNLSNTSEKVLEENSIYGLWKINHEGTTKDFIIKENKTFQFIGHNCTSKEYSEGKWTEENGLFVLTSDIKYKKLFSVQVSDEEEKIRKQKEGKWNNLNYKFPDTMYWYFEKSKFKLEDNKLSWIGNGNDTFDMKFTFVHKN